LFCSDEFKNSIDSLNISGFIGGFISPFDGLTNECNSTFNNVHGSTGSFSSSFDTSNDGHWVNKVLDIKTCIQKVVFLLLQVHDGCLEGIWVNHVVELLQTSIW
jgi:hypothetical protein